MRVDLDVVRSFLTWDRDRDGSRAPFAIQAREYLIALVVAVEHAREREELVRALIPHWRTAALGAETDAERETWLICADQLSTVLRELSSSGATTPVDVDGVSVVASAPSVFQWKRRV